MYWNRFDIVEAYYLALCYMHGGQGSRRYARLSKLLGYFKPGPTLNEDSLTKNGREIFENVMHRWVAEDKRRALLGGSEGHNG